MQRVLVTISQAHKLWARNDSAFTDEQKQRYISPTADVAVRRGDERLPSRQGRQSRQEAAARL